MTMDDLISRKALDDAFTELRWNEDGTLNHFGDRPDWCMHGSEVDKLIQNAPSVPAVPLDKLCEWLSENSIIIPCEYCPNFSNDYCAAIRATSIIPCPKTADDWRRAITKWMEEQDATD